MKGLFYFFSHLFDTEGWPPRWHCGQWSAVDGWMYIISDLLVWSAYFFIPILIIYYMRSRERALFKPIFWLFAAFILACGFTHLLDAVAFWWPAYRFNAFAKLITAGVSWTTVFAITRVLPAALKFKSPTEYQSEIDEKEEAQRSLALRNDELQYMLQRLNRQNKQLEDYTFITSHNLRAPVTNLSSLLFLLEHSETPEERKQILERLSSSVNSLGATLEHMLSVTKLKADKSLENEEVNLEEALLRTLESLQADVLLSQADITYDFSAAPVLKVYPLYLESIMLNLLSNALKYRNMDRQLEIRLKSAETKEYVELSVTDNGIGIDLEKHRDKVFGLYKTFHEHTEARGVGLFMTKAQVEAMNGEIFVDSVPDAGSTFSIRFYK